MSTPSLNAFQQQSLEALKKQQDAYLAAVRAWKDASGSAPSASMPQMPTFGAMPDAADLPSAAEVFAANQAFMTRVFEEQQRFFASLNDILGRQ